MGKEAEKKQSKKVILEGTVRIKVKGLTAYEKTKTGWKRINKKFPNLQNVVKLFKAHNQFKILIDTKDPKFLKGQLSPDGQPQGARINVLPNLKVLDKAYSLFAEHLTIHDQDSHDHWDVLYMNKGGTYSYIYTKEKKKAHQDSKYKKVDRFEKLYPQLLRNATKALKDTYDNLAVPIYTLLKTYMRVGNEIYYKAHHHKGLSTLMKRDVKINKDNVGFRYMGKDGVPVDIKKRFPSIYVKRLKELLKLKKDNQFLFTSSNSSRLLHENDFKQAFKNYCGEEFYPHIVRSHYATMQVKEFLKRNRKASKEQVQELYLKIAHDLGHKKFDQKKHRWQDHYTVVVHNYVQPALVERVEKIIR